MSFFKLIPPIYYVFVVCMFVHTFFKGINHFLKKQIFQKIKIMKFWSINMSVIFGKRMSLMTYKSSDSHQTNGSIVKQVILQLDPQYCYQQVLTSSHSKLVLICLTTSHNTSLVATMLFVHQKHEQTPPVHCICGTVINISLQLECFEIESYSVAAQPQY